MKIKSQRILIVGGGTGGHVYPALAVANELVKQGVSKTAIRFIGARRGLEATVIPAAGFSIDLLSGRGLKRSFSPQSFLVWGAMPLGQGSWPHGFGLSRQSSMNKMSLPD